jgi:hypothetical protein
MAAVMVSLKYFSGRDRDTENDKIFRLFAVLADLNQDLPLPSCPAGNGKVIVRSARTAARHTQIHRHNARHRGYNLLQSAARQSPWLELAAVCSQTVTVVTT